MALSSAVAAFPRPVESEQGPAQMMQGVGAGGRRLHGDLQGGQRLLEAPGIDKHHSQVEVVHRILGRDAAFLLEVVDGLLDGAAAPVQELHGPQVEAGTRHPRVFLDGAYEHLAGLPVLAVVAVGPSDQNPGLRNRTLLGHVPEEPLGGLRTLQTKVAAGEREAGLHVLRRGLDGSLQLLHRHLRLAARVEGPGEQANGAAIARAAREQTPEVVRSAIGIAALEREFGQGEQRAPRFEGGDERALVGRLGLGRGAAGAVQIAEQQPAFQQGLPIPAFGRLRFVAAEHGLGLRQGALHGGVGRLFLRRRQRWRRDRKNQGQRPVWSPLRGAPSRKPAGTPAHPVCGGSDA